MRPGGHPCSNAHKALKAAGHDPEVIKGYGLTLLPDTPFNASPARKRAKELTGSSTLPFLELDDGTAIKGSDKIKAWAEANPAA
jgi:glutaredoxin